MKTNGKKLSCEVKSEFSGEVSSEVNSEVNSEVSSEANSELSSDIDIDIQSKGRVKKVFRSTSSLRTSSLRDRSNHASSNKANSAYRPAAKCDPLSGKHMDALIAQWLEKASSQLGLHVEIIRAWLSQYEGASLTTQLLVLRFIATYKLDPLQYEILLIKQVSVPLTLDWQVFITLNGWIQLLHAHPQFMGITFTYSPVTECEDLWIECAIYRKDHHYPITVREYLNEAKGESSFWKDSPKRMLRNRALAQGARLALGIAPGGFFGNTSNTGNANITGNTGNAEIALNENPSTQLSAIDGDQIKGVHQGAPKSQSRSDLLKALLQ
jgi:hypothetical protein